MEENENLLEWVFIAKCKIPEDIVDVLAPGEVAVASYRTLRVQQLLYRDKRIIIRDVQGLTGKRLNFTPYHIHQ